MSVEIEVGLENAAKVRTPSGEPFKREEKPQPLVSSRTRGALILGGIVVILAVIALLVYYHNRESTDDAQVDGHITPVAAKISGRVGKVLVLDNQPVKAGELLVQIDPADYQAALDQAKAALALAESEARSAGFDVHERPGMLQAELPAPPRSLRVLRLISCVPRHPTSKHKRRI